ncbi:uncharacterized protein LOC124454050 [Xenia sp. Carnegie-2017]|uniref:uncharacterized protein LOC124454050 n=1 Tax=Xenia sp. Carnegie-2017 TaxID=2897299 RepID=UPI001F0460A2|nr:uncharacterized protein LOC124454050 [Xenia sp. Carnegie-2017]
MLLLKSFMLGWFAFCNLGFQSLYAEYFNLFLKQLGFNPGQIGLTTMFGLIYLAIPFYLYFGEKYRARKVLVVFNNCMMFVVCLLPLLSLIVPSLKTKCVVSSDITNKSIQNSSGRSSLLYTADSLSNRALNLRRVGNNTQSQTISSQNQSERSISLLSHVNRLSLNRRQNLSKSSETNQIKYSHLRRSQPSIISILFLLLTISRTLTLLSSVVNISSLNSAIVTYLRESKAKIGYYLMWGHAGAAFFIASTSLLAKLTKVRFCDTIENGYFVSFIVGGICLLLSMFSLPWFEYEYSDARSFKWSGVRNDILSVHYGFMFALLLFLGMCTSFQLFWEFWYLDRLSATPLLLGTAALVRRPILVLSVCSSKHLITTIGELKTLCISLLFYACSYLALAFVRKAWLVIAIDTIQATAYGFCHSAFVVHFSKAASKENSNMIIGLQETTWAIGYDGGATLMGILFHLFGTQMTFVLYSSASGVLVFILMLYIYHTKSFNDYKEVDQGGVDE